MQSDCTLPKCMKLATVVYATMYIINSDTLPLPTDYTGLTIMVKSVRRQQYTRV